MGRKSHIQRFCEFELDHSNRQLRRNGHPIELGSRYFDALALLLANQGDLVTKDEFMDKVWHGTPVTDEALTQCIRSLRRALGDDATNPRFIETVPKHGYRFLVAEVVPSGAAIDGDSAHVAGACTLAGLVAGALAGLTYGIIAGTGSAGHVPILAAMIGALGLLAGAGLGAGAGAAFAWRGKADHWVIVGMAGGGIAVGAVGNALGREGVGLLSGISVERATGPFEGAVLGAAAGIVAWAVMSGYPRLKALGVAVTAAALAGGLIHWSGGTLLAGSLHSLEEGGAGTQISVARIGMIFGEPAFTRAARGLTIFLECQVFITALAFGLLAVRDRHSRRT